MLGYETVSTRIISIRFQAKLRNINIIQVYAPTTDPSDEDIENFYLELETTMSSIPKREIAIILGDLNAKVDDTTNYDHIKSIVGKYGLGNRNPRSERLIQFCIDNNLTITNTLFQLPKKRLY